MSNPSLAPHLARAALFAGAVFGGAACVPVAARPHRTTEIEGAIADVRTRSGRYDGYEVQRVCGQGDARVGVRGLGPAPAPNYRDESAREAWRRDVLAALEPVGLLHMSGFGAACGQEGLIVAFADYRVVDAAIAAVGRLLRARRGRAEVAIVVAGVPLSPESLP